jgi:hypothetical protein
MSYLRLGNRTEAFRSFDRDMDNHCGRTVFDLVANPRLDKIREDDRFRALLRRVNLPHGPEKHQTPATSDEYRSLHYK